MMSASTSIRTAIHSVSTSRHDVRRVAGAGDDANTRTTARNAWQCLTPSAALAGRDAATGALRHDRDCPWPTGIDSTRRLRCSRAAGGVGRGGRYRRGRSGGALPAGHSGAHPWRNRHRNEGGLPSRCTRRGPAHSRPRRPHVADAAGDCYLISDRRLNHRRPLPRATATRCRRWVRKAPATLTDCQVHRDIDGISVLSTDDIEKQSTHARCPDPEPNQRSVRGTFGWL